MKIRRGNVSISIEQVDGYGKNPGLWVGTESPATMTKVASFGSADAAETFVKHLKYLLEGRGDALHAALNCELVAELEKRDDVRTARFGPEPYRVEGKGPAVVLIVED